MGLFYEKLNVVESLLKNGRYDRAKKMLDQHIKRDIDFDLIFSRKLVVPWMIARYNQQLVAIRERISHLSLSGKDKNTFNTELTEAWQVFRTLYENIIHLYGLFEDYHQQLKYLQALVDEKCTENAAALPEAEELAPLLERLEDAKNILIRICKGFRSLNYERAVALNELVLDKVIRELRPLFGMEHYTPKEGGLQEKLRTINQALKEFTNTFKLELT